MTHPQLWSFQLPTTAPKAAGWFVALAGVALLAFAIQGQADSRETLGAGDTIRITVFQTPQLTTETRVSERGTIIFPLIGEAVLGGQTPAGVCPPSTASPISGNMIVPRSETRVSVVSCGVWNTVMRMVSPAPSVSRESA